MAIVTYSVGTMSGLLVLGRLSNHLGRRLTAIASLGLLLLNVHDIGILLAGRVLMGVGTGLASSTLTSYIVDAAPTRPKWLASVASSQGPMLGLTVGAIASGALVQFGLWPRDLIYLACVGFLSVSAVLIAIAPETATPTPGGARDPHTDATGNGTCDSSSTFDDDAFNPTERPAGKTIIRVRP
jgi:MFS family permease